MYSLLFMKDLAFLRSKRCNVERLWQLQTAPVSPKSVETTLCILTRIPLMIWRNKSPNYIQIVHCIKDWRSPEKSTRKNIHGKEWPEKPINYTWMPQETNNKKGNFQSLFEIAANRMGIGTEFHAIKVCHDATKILNNWLPEFTQDYRVASLRKGCLTIKTQSSVISQQLQIKAHLLQEELNKKNGQKTVTKVRIKTSWL